MDHSISEEVETVSAISYFTWNAGAGRATRPCGRVSALATHADALDTPAVGAPDVVYREVPIAYVVTYPNATVEESELLDHLRERITKV